LVNAGKYFRFFPFESKSWIFKVEQSRFQKDFYNEYISVPGDMIAQATRQWIDQASIFKFVNTIIILCL
jgi:hypothetical protein